MGLEMLLYLILSLSVPFVSYGGSTPRVPSRGKLLARIMGLMLSPSGSTSLAKPSLPNLRACLEEALHTQPTPKVATSLSRHAKARNSPRSEQLVKTNRHQVTTVALLYSLVWDAEVY
eukprot:2584478-Amphidinium_carterae.1